MHTKNLDPFLFFDSSVTGWVVKGILIAIFVGVVAFNFKRLHLLIGFALSIVLHVGFIYSSEIFAPPAKVVEKKVVKKQYLETQIVKEEEPEEVVSETTSDATAQVVEFAPPMQTDVPSVVAVDSFVQTVQPPPPEGLKPNSGALTIPTARPGQGGTKLANVFNINELDQQPEPRIQGNPQYPFEMRRAGVTGEVLVEFIVNVNGDIQDAQARRSSQREFEANAIQAVMKWKFRPGKKGGKAVNTRMQVPIQFSITED